MWLAGRVLLYDGLFVPGLLITGILTRKRSRAGYLIPFALIIGGAVLLVVLPLIYTAPTPERPTR